MRRREFLHKLLWGGITLATAKRFSLPGKLYAEPSSRTPAMKLSTRPLGKTGHSVGLFSLGGEGVLRTSGRLREAQAVIERALDLGVNYCDTAPAYQQSQDYYGQTLGARRNQIFLASKTHERNKAGCLRLLENSLQRLKTDHLDLWQLHDLRERSELDQIFGPGGAIEAVEQAKRNGKIRFAGITGHHDPAILLEAMQRYAFDSVLVPVNVADKARLSFLESVVPAAQQKGMAIIGMKVLEHGELFGGLVNAQEAISYALSQSVSTIIIGCASPQQVEENFAAAASFTPWNAARIVALEAKVMPRADGFNLFKAER